MGKANVMVGILHATAAEGWQPVMPAAEGRNNTSWREKQLKAEVPVCVAGEVNSVQCRPQITSW